MQKIIAFFMSIIAFFASLFGIKTPAKDDTQPTEPDTVASVFERNVDWGNPSTVYYSGLQAEYNSAPANIAFSYVRGYPNQSGSAAEGGEFIVGAENDGAESIVFNAVKGRSYVISTSRSCFYPGSHAKFGQVDTAQVVTGTKWYKGTDLYKTWNNTTSITVTPDFSGYCFVYLKNETDDALIGNVTVTEYCSLFNKYTTAAQMYALYDKLAAAYPDYITKTDLGVCSDGVQHLYEYDFTPAGSSSSMPEILIISGQHGYEKGSSFGVYYFFKDLCENYGINGTLSYLHSSVAFKIIPVVNPYGWDKFSYYNYNGVNLNRNYDNTDFTSTGTGTNKGGSIPFDQPETAIVRDFVERNKDAVLFIDNHTNTGEIAKSMKTVLWIDTIPNQDDYYNNLIEMCKLHIANTKENFNNDYNLGLSSTDEFGTFTNGNSQYDENFPSADAWATTHENIMALTFEGFNAFPDETYMYSRNSLKANSEMFGNFIELFVSTYSSADN